MIVKKMKRTNFSKSKAVMISELVDYIFAPYDELGREKLAHYGTLNFLTTTRAAQKNEMIALAEESIQSRMPVTHWVLSWKDAEQPTPTQLDFAVQHFLRRMELEGHQAFYVQHKNTVIKASVGTYDLPFASIDPVPTRQSSAKFRRVCWYFPYPLSTHPFSTNSRIDGIVS